MKIVLGLGNPGERYRPTRHNLGFRVVDALAERWGGRFGLSEALGRTAWSAEVRVGGEEVVLAKPRTYMNRSGRAAGSLLAYYGATPSSLLVVYDDADLELGRIRIRPEGSSGGHNGMRSLIAALRTESFPRIRLGILGEDRGHADLEDYVLEEFGPEEGTVVERLVGLGAEAVAAILRDGLEAAMNRFNGLVAGAGET